MSLTRRLVGAKPRFSDLMRHLPRGAEFGGKLDDYLDRLAGVGRGLPTPHASTHLPSGSDPLTTVAPVGLGNAASAGTANSFARSDHIHKRDVRVAKAGVDVGTRNRLNLIEGSGIVLTVADDAGSDEVDITVATPNANLLAWVAISMGSDL